MPLRVTGGPSRISMTDTVKRPLLRRVRASPRVYVADGFATAAEVTHVIERAERLERHPPSGLEATRGVAGFAFEMPVAGDTVLSQLCDAIYIALGFGNVCGDTVRFRRYERGNSHPAHCDVYEIDGAHLVATAIVYLNDTDGGATFFADAEGGALSIDPQLGRLAVWFNYWPDGSVDNAARHSGLNVTSGHKSTITAFIYNHMSVSCGELPMEA